MKIETIQVYGDLSAEVIPAKGNSKSSTLFVFHKLRAGDAQVADDMDIYSFVELMSAFISNQLQIEHEYTSGTKGGYVAKIATQKNQYSLRIIVGEKTYFYDKHQCRVIARIINRIISKCTFRELTGFER